jgi:hypothetical protein
MNSQELRALQESYSQVYDLDESAIGDRARNAVADQRLDAAQGDTQQSVDKLGKREKVTRASAHIAAKKTETTARNMHPKPGTTGAYRITDSFDLYNIILSHLLDEGYADTNEAAITIMANMSEDWRESIVEAKVDAGLTQAQKREVRTARAGRAGVNIPNSSLHTGDVDRRAEHRERDEMNKDAKDIRRGRLNLPQFQGTTGAERVAQVKKEKGIR